jgi:ATP-binding cassette subfamily F protein uup
VLGLDGRGNAETFADYSQWETWQEEGSKFEARGSREPEVQEVREKGGKKKLSYLEAREYASIEEKVEAAETRLNAARDVLDDSAVATNAEALTAALHEMELAQAAMDELYARWAELTEKVS